MEHSGIWEFRACPSCNSVKIPTQPDSTSAVAAEAQGWETVKDSFVGLRADQLFFSYYRVINCGILYSPRYFSNSQLNILYSVMPNNLMGENVGTASRTQYGYADQILRHAKEVKSYLEMGPDIGLVAKRISESTKSRCIFVEPNIDVHDALLSNAKKFLKLQIVRDFQQIQIGDTEALDLIVGIHVLDHLLEPRIILEKFRKIASPSGKLCIVVHNERSFLRKLLRRTWPPFCLQHPQLFNPSTINDLLATNGWKTISIKRTRNYYSLRNLCRMLCSITRLPPFLSRIVPNWEIPVYLGNIMVIAEVDKDFARQN